MHGKIFFREVSYFELIIFGESISHQIFHNHFLSGNRVPRANLEIMSQTDPVAQVLNAGKEKLTPQVQKQLLTHLSGK